MRVLKRIRRAEESLKVVGMNGWVVLLKWLNNAS